MALHPPPACFGSLNFLCPFFYPVGVASGFIVSTLSAWLFGLMVTADVIF